MTFTSSTKYRNGNGNGNGATKESPWDRASIPSKYFLSFMLPLFRKGFKGQITLDDMGAPPKLDQSRSLGLRLQQDYNRELLTRRKPSFLRALIRTFGFQVFLFGILDFCSKCIAFPMQTIALGWLIRDTGIYLNIANQPLAEAPQTNTTTITPIDTNGTTTLMPLVTTTTPATAGIAATEAGPPILAIPNLTSEEAYWRIIYDAILLLLFTVLATTLAHPFFFKTYHVGMKCRVAACFMIYKKALRLSQSAMSETTVGQMVNLLSNDVNRFDQAVQLTPYIVLAPLQAIVVIAILATSYLGLFPTLASLLAMMIFVIIQSCMGRGFSKFRAQTARRTDERVRLMNEIILAMRIIKMYAWEKPFKQLVSTARKREITTIGIAAILKTINQTLFFVSSKIIVFAALITYVLLGNSFNPEIVFVSIGLANLVRISLTLFFPNAVGYLAETIISCRRINAFLMLPEIETSPATYKASNDSYGCKYLITLNKVYASWASKNQELAASSDARWAILRNLSLSVKARDLMLIVGRVGSGKSSVLMSMLGELPIASGKLEVNGRISYAPQEAWIFSGTVRENILFGAEFKQNRYNEVLRVCSLERDLEILVDGDSTIVGERGVSLSGGQKARVNLARALYHEADIYLLDDPLSAVDAPVAKHIFNESLRTFLGKKTVILATHQLQFLRYATKVLVIDRDSPAAFGTLQEVMGSEAFSVMNYSKEAFEDATTTEAGTDAATDTGAKPEVERRVRRQATAATRGGGAGGSGSGSSKNGSEPSPSRSRSSTSEGSPPESRHTRSPAKSWHEDKDKDLGLHRELIRASSQASSNLSESVKVIAPIGAGDIGKSHLISAAIDDAPAEQKASLKTKAGDGGSERRQGTEALSAISANFSTYLYYLSNACGPITFIWFILTNVAVQGLYQYTDFYLSFWTDSVQRRELEGAQFTPKSFVDYLTTGEISGIYTILVALNFFASFCRTTTFFIGTLCASVNIHNKLFNSVIRAPMSFFDFSPIGILLNRLSRDIGFVDENLPATGIEIVAIFVNILGILTLAIIIDYKNLAAAIPLLVLAFLLRNCCARTITRLKQIEGVTRSPIYSQLSTTLSGLATIRAFKVQDEFVRLFDKNQDTHSSAWFNYICSGRWLTVSMDWLCLIFIGIVITLLLTLSLGANNASMVGLLISQVVVLPGPFQWGMRQLIEMESQMTSVQRIKEFSELKPEADNEQVDGDDGYKDGNNKWKDNSDFDSDSDAPRFQVRSGQIEAPRERAGEVKFINVKLSYFSDELPVLKGLSFTIRPREKVGIVGRTGAGKSSIVSVLFRLYEFEGQVEVNGRDTKRMRLADLRRSMSIIPQDPILFGGTIRKNLDPFSEFTDGQLWDALEAVKLKSLFASYAQGLEFVINEGGANFSVGQRQLICLARAIVRRNKILILDEATANVDPETDKFIQRTIASQFANCTVITIAHRLVTVVDSDRVLVLDRGQVREFAEPFELVRKGESGLFAQMVLSSAQQAPRLMKLIEEAHLAREKGARPLVSISDEEEDKGDKGDLA